MVVIGENSFIVDTKVSRKLVVDWSGYPCEFIVLECFSNNVPTTSLLEFEVALLPLIEDRQE